MKGAESADHLSAFERDARCELMTDIAGALGRFLIKNKPMPVAVSEINAGNSTFTDHSPYQRNVRAEKESHYGRYVNRVD